MTYSFFHPRDWCLGQNQPAPWGTCSEAEWYHENDFEGALFVIRKDPLQTRGDLWAIVTRAHTGFETYLDASAANSGDIAMAPGRTQTGSIQYWNHQTIKRPMLQVQARGHGVYGGDEWTVAPNDPTGGFPGGDGVIYWLQGKTGSRAAEVPSGPTDFDVAYDLVWIDAPGGLWSRRFQLGTGTPFEVQARMRPSNETYGFELGANVGWPAEQRANPPWAWDSLDDGVPVGFFLESPADFALDYFVIPDLTGWNGVYEYNPFLEGGGVP